MDLEVKRSLALIAWLVSAFGGLIACLFAWGLTGIVVDVIFSLYLYLAIVRLRAWIDKSKLRYRAENGVILIFSCVFTLAIYSVISWELFGLSLNIPLGLLPPVVALVWFYLLEKEE